VANFANRMSYAMQLRGVKQSELSQKTGIGKSSISTYLSGEYVPKQRNVYKIATALEVNVSWLLGYDVPMNRDEISLSEETKKPLVNEDPELTEYLEMLATRAECRMLFSFAKTATKADVQKAVKIIEAIRGIDHNNDDVET